MNPGMLEHLAGGADPQRISEMGHVSAASLLDRVHHTQDPEVVRRVLTLVEHEGVDLIAELWSDAEPESLPGMLWRLYMLRTWMRTNGEAVSRLWRLGEPVGTSASAIAGVDEAPVADDIARVADSILSGAFTGDFAVALERAGVFCEVCAAGLVHRSRQLSAQEGPHADAGPLLKRAESLRRTAKVFMHGAVLWRRGRLE